MGAALMNPRIAAALAALTLAVPPTFAAEPDYPPVLTPLDASATLPDGVSFDTLGLSLGMPIEEATAILMDLAQGAPLKENSALAGVGDNRGNVFRFRYDIWRMAEFTAADGSREQVTVTFTTNVNEARAVRIERRVQYMGDQLGDADAFIAALTTKFGAPSWREDFFGTRIYWMWFDGARQEPRPEFSHRVRHQHRDTAAICIDDVSMTHGYQYGAEERGPGCGPIIEVQIDHPARADLMRGVSIRLVDYGRHNRNRRDTDAWALAEFEKMMAAQSGTTPKL